jgi:hypothetical protein
VKAPRPKAPAAPRPVAPAPAPAPSSPFDFGGAPAGPEADFGFTDHTDGGLKGISLRTRINRAAGWLNTAAGSMVIYTLFTVSIGIAVFVMTRAWPSLVIAGCSPFLILPFPIIVVIGARMLARTRRWGMALTGAIVSLTIGVLGILLLFVGAIGFVLSLFGGAAVQGGPAAQAGQFLMIVSCGNLVLLTVVGFSGTFAGIVAMRTLLNADIKRAFS